VTLPEPGPSGLPELSVSGPGKVTTSLECMGPAKARCALKLFPLTDSSSVRRRLTQARPLLLQTTSDRLSKRKGARKKIGKKGRKRLKLRLNRRGKTLVRNAGGPVPVLAELTVTEKKAVPRREQHAVQLVPE